MLARLRAPGLQTIGLEQMNLHKHNGALRKSMRKLYPQLDAFVVLTEQDREHYGRVLKGKAPPLHVIPNTVRPLPGAKADLAAKTVYAAGRFRYQKGFELLIPAWEATAKAHPDWRLRLRGRGHLETPLPRPDRAARARGLGGHRGPGGGHRLRHGGRRRCSCSPRASRASR